MQSCDRLLGLAVVDQFQSVLYLKISDEEDIDSISNDIKLINANQNNRLSTRNGMWIVNTNNILSIMILVNQSISQQNLQKFTKSITSILKDFKQPKITEADKSRLNQYYSNAQNSNTNLDKANESIEMVKLNVKQGIEKMVNNKDQLTQIDDKSDQLLKGAQMFNKNSNTLRRKMQRQQMIIRLVILIILLIAIVWFYCDYFQCFKS